MMAAAWPSARSRTMAREITMPAEAPNAAIARKMASHGQARRQRAADRAEGEDDEACHQRDAAAEAVGQSALGDLADGETGEPRGQSELRGAGRGAEGGLHRWECGQIHVGRGWTDGDEQAEEVRQPGGVSWGERGCSSGGACGLGWMGVVPGSSRLRREQLGWTASRHRVPVFGCQQPRREPSMSEIKRSGIDNLKPDRNLTRRFVQSGFTLALELAIDP